MASSTLKVPYVSQIDEYEAPPTKGVLRCNGTNS
jgi:hypothetical protein